ncbi:TPA: EamA family transporter, partial [Pseudomonas aeruginosa]|nr:EamA-like transporter family protein [Pseudomonas aeruginosa]
MLALALATLLQKRWDDAPGSLAVVLSVQIGAALPAFAGLALAEGSLRPPLSGGFLFGLAWLVLLPTFGGYGLYWLGLRHLSAQGGSAALYLSPALTLLWAHWMFAEPLTPMLLGGLLLSLAGLGWLYRAERR